MNITTTVRALASPIRLLFLDVDGVLTDGKLYFFAGGIARAFHTLDGLGIRTLIQNDIQVALVSAATDDNDIARRAEHLGIVRVHTGVEDKLTVVQQILQDESLTPNCAAYMGDDLPDVPPMQHVGFAIAPQTAVPQALAVAHWMPDLPAGAGAVRELCDLIMATRS